MTSLTALFALLAVIVLLAGLGSRRRVREETEREDPVVDDDALRRIQEEGRLPAEEDDDPLDMDEIAREEERFWEETWDEPEEFS